MLRRPDFLGICNGLTSSSARYRTFASCLLFSWLAVLPNAAFAQQDLELTAADTSSPRETLRSFIDGCNKISESIQRDKFLDPDSPKHRATANRIIDCLDTSELPDFSRVEYAADIAICIKEILDRVALPPWEEIPGVEEIQEAGGFELVPRWRIPGTRITIARMEQGPQKHEYLFSAGTVSRALDYYESVKQKPYRTTEPAVSPGFRDWYLSAPRTPLLAGVLEKMPLWFRQGRSFGMTRWKWPFYLLALGMAVGAMFGSYWLYLKVTPNVRPENHWKYWLTLSLPIAAACVPSVFLHYMENSLGVRGTPLYVTTFLCTLASLVTGVVVIFAMATRISETIITSPRISTKGLNAQLIRIISKLVALATVVALLLYGGQYLGFAVGTILASAGIGGLAIALGAQDTLKDLFGTISLMADKPFRVGERIITTKYDGVVEDIGLRSTRLRLLNGHLVTLPNDQLARSDVENVGRRPYIRRTADIHLPLDTPREALEQALEIIRTSLQQHEGMDPSLPPRAFFTDYLPNAFKIHVIYWYHPPNYWDFLAMSEKVNLTIFRAFEEQGIQFSLPVRVAHTSITSQEKPVEVKMIGEA